MSDHSLQSLFSPGEAAEYFALKHPSPLIIDSTFHLWNVWWLAELSRLVYREDRHNKPAHGQVNDTATLLAKANFESLGEFIADETSTYGVLLKTNGVDPIKKKHTPCLIMVFCGSNEINDWRLNIKAYQKDFFKLGKVHRGFQKAFLSIKQQIMDKQALFNYPLFITGHSLGAGLATLSMAYLSMKSINTLACYTFGSPKVGDSRFVDTMNNLPIYRVINHSDLVTQLPFEFGQINYEHCGENVFLDENAKLSRELNNDEITERQFELLDLKEIFQDSPFKHVLNKFQRDIPSFLSDHSPINYVNKLAIALNQH